jgi:endonuclease/exonuclease/phosphatase family metal-dependent hydrolase
VPRQGWVPDCPEDDLSLLACITGSVARRGATRLAAALLLLGAAAFPASAQTLQLTDSSATTLRGGAYAGTNYASQTLLETRASDDASYTRRVLLKFDTHNTIPAGTPIVSAMLTLTQAGGNAETRTVGLYRETSSYDETYATWNKRNSSTAWSTPGGDIAERYTYGTVTNVVGGRVSFDVTQLVQGVVNGAFGSSRYTRVVLIDLGASSQSSYKQYYSDEAGDVTVRPVLVVTLGAAAAPAPAPAPTPSTTGVQLKVMDWNIHHGVGTDGRYDIDRLATWMAKMNPDVITLNEVEKYTGWGNEDQPARFKSLLQTKTSRTWYAHFTQEYGDWTSKGKGHLILSKYPFESTGYTTTTPSSGLNGAGAAGQAAIIVNGRRINLIVGHLDPSSQTMRLIQAKEVIAWAATFAENRIITGDMNAWPDQSSIVEYRKTYYDSWDVAEAKGTATGISGITPFGATKKGRIDYIFFSKNAPNLVVLSSKTPDTRDSSGVMPSDHRPVVTTFEVR